MASGLGPLPAGAAAATLFGAAVGSFLNVVAYRLPRGLSPLRPRRSFCPACRSPIAARHNVPVISWLVLGGRCRSCGWRIPARYVLVEAGTALGFAATYVTLALLVGTGTPRPSGSQSASAGLRGPLFGLAVAGALGVLACLEGAWLVHLERRRLGRDAHARTRAAVGADEQPPSKRGASHARTSEGREAEGQPTEERLAEKPRSEALLADGSPTNGPPAGSPPATSKERARAISSPPAFPHDRFG